MKVDVYDPVLDSAMQNDAEPLQLRPPDRPEADVFGLRVLQGGDWAHDADPRP